MVEIWPLCAVDKVEEDLADLCNKEAVDLVDLLADLDLWVCNKVVCQWVEVVVPLVVINLVAPWAELLWEDALLAV